MKVTIKKIKARLGVAEEIFRQQWEMYKGKVNRIAHRIVSLHRPYVRPIKRGKQRQDVEFGGEITRTSLSGPGEDHEKYSAGDSAVIRSS